MAVDVSGPSFTLSGFTANIGEGGLGFRVRAKELEDAGGALPPDLPVTVALRLPLHPKPLVMEARTVWSMPFGRDAQGRRAVEVGVRFEPGQAEAELQIQQFLSGFRYRIACLDFGDGATLTEALAEQFELTLVRGEDELERAGADGQLGLILLGEGGDPERGLVRLARVLELTDGAEAPPIVYGLGRTATQELERMLSRSGRLVCLKLPTEPALLRALAHRCIESHALAVDNERLAFELESALARVRKENDYYRSRLATPTRLDGVIGDSAAMQRVYDQVERVARVDASIFIIGETGTGKGLVARAIHALSPRSRGPFVSQNCAAVAETLLDSELFGHSKGAFTGAVGERAGLFEVASGGTVFLDEIGEMTPSMQAKLLNVLQDGEVRRVGSAYPTRVDVRVLCASHRNLETLVREGKFREDLYYRLVSFVIRLPPLRERPEDIQPLALHFLAQFAARNRLPPRELSADALDLLRAHDWPGNVRQLQHTLERLAILAPPGQVIGAALIREALADLSEAERPLHASAPAASPPSASASASASLDGALADHERTIVTATLERTGWVIADAARALGMERSTLSRRIRRLGIRLPHQR